MSLVHSGGKAQSHKDPVQVTPDKAVKMTADQGGIDSAYSLLQAMVYTNRNMLKKGNKKIIIEFKLKGETIFFWISEVDRRAKKWIS